MRPAPIEKFDQILSDIALFRGLNPEQIALIQRSIKEKKFKKGEMVFLEGKCCDQIYILRSGQLKIFRTASNGREQTLEVLRGGDTCACNPGVNQWSCSSSAQALTDGCVWILPRPLYAKLIKFNAHMTGTLSELLANRLQQYVSLIEDVAMDDPQRRLVKFILGIAGSKSQRTLDFPYTHQEVANRLGLARETVSRHVQQLKRSKLIALKQKSLTILDLGRLQRLLS